MAIQVSTKFKERILGPESFPQIFNGGCIRVYSGAQPVTADAAATGTLLATVSNDGIAWTPGATGAGLVFVASGPWVTKDPARTWKMLGSAVGTAGWFRLVGPVADPGTLSYSVPRIDGSIGVAGSGAELVLSTTAVSVGSTLEIQQFAYTIPPVIG